MSLDEKIREAERIVRQSTGENGIWASPGLTEYRYQCWTRDLSIGGIHGLLATERADVARVHLKHLLNRQEEDGSISDWFPETEKKLLFQKATRLLKEPSRITKIGTHLPLLARNIPFLKNAFPELARVEVGHEWTPNTTDSELHYIAAVNAYVTETQDNNTGMVHARSIEKALDYTMDKKENTRTLLEWKILC